MNKKGLWLRTFREDKGLTRAQLAARAGISPRTLEKYEQGVLDLKDASYSVVEALADVLEISPVDFFPRPKKKTIKTEVSKNSDTSTTG